MPFPTDFTPPLTGQPAPNTNNTPKVPTRDSTDQTPPTGAQPTASSTTTTSTVTNVTLVHQDFSTADQVANTTSMTTLWSYSVPANTIPATGQLAVRLWGSYLANDVAASHYLWRISFGGTTFIGDAQTADVGPSPNRGPVMLDLVVSNMGATNSNRIDAVLHMGQPFGLTNGVGNPQLVEPVSAPLASAAKAIDTTSAATLTVAVQPSTANASVLVAYRFVNVTLNG